MFIFVEDDRICLPGSFEKAENTLAVRAVSSAQHLLGCARQVLFADANLAFRGGECGQAHLLKGHEANSSNSERQGSINPGLAGHSGGNCTHLSREVEAIWGLGRASMGRHGTPYEGPESVAIQKPMGRVY